MLHTTEALLWILVGASLGGVIQAALSRYAEFKESQGLGLALAAELRALRALVTFRKYLEIADGIVARLNLEGYVPTILDVMAISVTEDYFGVFHAVSPKIGILGKLAGEVATTYVYAKGIIEDFAQLERKKRELISPSDFLGVQIPPENLPAINEFMRQMLLAYTQDLRRLLGKCLETSVEEKLEARADKWWICHLLGW